VSDPPKPLEDQWGLFNEVPAAPEYPVREKYQAHLLEQYKLYVEMTDRVSQRRLTANSYFLSVNSALLAAVGYLTTRDNSSYLWLIGASGIVLSILWFQIITSYRDLNTAKFKILHEIERQLPLSLYYAEWNVMGRGESPKLYRPLSHIERLVPWIFIVLHGFVIIHSVFA
jgi:hypothetical protein